jgi:hypothetical protein
MQPLPWQISQNLMLQQAKQRIGQFHNQQQQELLQQPPL